MTKKIDEFDLGGIAADPSKLVEWARENAPALVGCLVAEGVSPAEAEKLVSRLISPSEHSNSNHKSPKRRIKFSELQAAEPTPMTDAEYLQVLLGMRRDGTT